MSPERLDPFPLLEGRASYMPSEWDLTDPARREYWLSLFRSHFEKLLSEAVEAAATEADARARAQGARGHFNEFLDAVSRDPTRFGRLDVMALCVARERSLRRFQFDDPYHSVKKRENERALPLLPALLAELDALGDRARWIRLVEGIFAGNIFDLGATETAALFGGNGRVEFGETRDRLRKRPWLVDHLDAWLERMQGPPHRAAVLFVDNAGPDIVLGMLPFSRELLRRGTQVVLTANSTPSLNDVTHPELVALLERVRATDELVDRAMEERRLILTPSGNGTPLIDLTRISGDLARVAVERRVDLVVLEGMGRAVESNYTARLSCDTVKVAMLKDPDVARFVGGEVYDLVFRFDRA